MRLGVISTAGIARKALLPALAASDHEALAIASRDADRARAVAADHDVPRAYGSYEALLADDDVDAVYNPLPNALHAEWTERAADAGKHVLCEKPLASDADEARAMVEHCADRGVTLMEAFMYRYHPRTERALAVAADHLGDVRSVSARFAFPLRGRPDDVRLDPDLAGGSAMDVGCYAVHAARLFLGDPDRVHAETHDGRDCGVDTAMAATLGYDDGATATVSSGFDTAKSEQYRVDGTDGWLRAEPAFGPDRDEAVTLEYAVDGRHVVEAFDPVDQYRLEVEHFADCVREGRAPLTDGADAVATMRVLDAVRESGATGEPVAL